jgi:hypothetical protein
MVEDTWARRERVWLEQVDAANRRGEGWQPDEFASEDKATWRAAVFDWDALKDSGLLQVQVDQRNAQGRPVAVNGIRLTAKGRQAIGRWPNDASQAVDELLRRIEDMIAVAGPKERSKLVRARDSLLDVGRDLLVDLAAAMLAKSAGL